MKNSMEFFGEALYAYWKGDKKSKFYLVYVSDKRIDELDKYELDLGIYFRNYDQLSDLEKKLISLSHGEILDVGCGTGYYIPALMKRGNTEGIDISEKVIKIAQKMGLKNCKLGNIFDFKSDKKYDTITLLQNNLGIAETLPRAKRLLKILSNLLNRDGQILNILRKYFGGDYIVDERYFEWKNKRSSNFRWITFNVNFLSKLCSEMDLKLEIIDENEDFYLIRISEK
ncbi:MAG: class I SAM-dependent methyltransferase [Candidatus Lokiarchaeia archaeon]